MIEYLNLKRVNAMHAGEIKDAIAGVADSGWYLQGAHTQQFEAQYADYIGTKHCVTCANGLDALTIILRAYIQMGLMNEGDEVIVPANTYIASILAITENHLKPVLVEPRIDTFQIDDSLIEQAITPRTRAVMIVHLYGKCAYTQRIDNICRMYSLKLIEDNAQSVGCEVINNLLSLTVGSQFTIHNAPHYPQSSIPNPIITKTGALGDVAAHSFYPAKNLGALGDAGAITTNDDELANIVRALVNYGSRRKYVFDYIGRNSRMDEIQAAVLSIKLEYLDKENARRREIAKHYIANIHNINIRMYGSFYQEPQAKDTDIDDVAQDSVYHIFPVLCENRDDLQQYLAENGIQTIIHYPIPPHKQECYKQWNSLSLPVTERIHREELSIPLNQTLTDNEVDKIVNVLNNYCKR